MVWVGPALRQISLSDRLSISAVEVQRDNAVLFAEGPPPAEASQTLKLKVGVSRPTQLLNKAQYGMQTLFGAPVERRDRDLATELKHGVLLVGREARLVQHHHALGLAQDVVVQRSLGDAVLGRGLREAHLLSDHGLDGLLELGLRPHGRLQLHQIVGL